MKMRRFHFLRIKDDSGVSGCGEVAGGVEFGSGGRVVLKWNSEHSSIAIYENMQDCIFIHGHGDHTKIVYEDPEEITCSEKSLV